MKFAGIALMWVGYTAVTWGWYRLGGPVDLLDLIVPGRATPSRGGTPAQRGTPNICQPPLVPTPEGGCMDPGH